MNKKKIWTKEECEFLEEKWGVISIPGLARRLGRSNTAIKAKAQKLGLGTHLSSREEITFSSLLITLGYSKYNNCTKKRLERLGFPFVYKASVNKKFTMVNINDFWEWAEKNRKELNFAKFPKFALGKEPKWVDEKRKADLMNPTKVNVNRVWTKEEENLLIEKVKSNKYTYKMLSEDLNRTEGAIKRRLLKLKVPYRPVPLNNHIKWTEDENKKMIDLYRKGYDSNAISKILNKTQLSICDRLRKLVV